ncbi:MAG: hypothetical protein L6R40_005742 [Gallowayella cf. fulva]|nr:MAG: hypothetical protein L6R40_005742 [Xanthomendoza cf. fulva]
MRTQTSRLLRRILTSSPPPLQPPSPSPWSCAPRQWQRSLQTAPANNSRAPDFAFAFDIDGVLLRSSSPLPRARETLTLLQRLRIPFILLTNGGGKHENDRVAELSRLLSVRISPSMFIQSHTPFADLIHQIDERDRTKTPLKDKTILPSRTLPIPPLSTTQSTHPLPIPPKPFNQSELTTTPLPLKQLRLPLHLITAHPNLWPFTSPYSAHYAPHARPLPHPISTPHSSSPHLRISAIFVFADPRDWALDIQLLLDCLLSRNGLIGTSRPQKNIIHPPHLYFSNPDLQWSSSYHLPRLGQGSFQAAFQGVWHQLTNGRSPPLPITTIGKPSQGTFEFAEKRLLVAHHLATTTTTEHHHHEEEEEKPKKGRVVGGEKKAGGFRKIYMVGDNPLSDIVGGNTYRSPFNSTWDTILVRSGVYNDEPLQHDEHKPTVIVDGVGDAVEWALRKEGWTDGGDLPSDCLTLFGPRR